MNDRYVGIGLLAAGSALFYVGYLPLADAAWYVRLAVYGLGLLLCFAGGATATSELPGR